MTPDEALALGVARGENGDFEGALSAFQQVEAAVPGHPDTARLIGQTYLRAGRYREGASALAEAARRRPDQEILFGLMWALVQLGAWGDVEAAYKYFHTITRGDGRCQALVGLALLMMNRHGEAAEVLEQAVARLPGENAVRRNYASALVGAGQGEKAVEVLVSLFQPWDGGAGEQLPLSRLDQIAEGYDDNGLHHYFSERLVALYDTAFPSRHCGQVLDLGMGTGLLGARLAGRADFLTGVERSPAMLAQAAARGIYGRVIEGCLPEALADVPGPFDTVMASCMLYHFADLEPFFRHAARSLSSGGAFVFSVDPMREDADIGVTGPGEYGHSRAYLRRLAAAAGLEEVLIEVAAHRRMPGFWCAFRKD